MTKRPPVVSLPFTTGQLEDALAATRHEDWVWDIAPMRTPITDELMTYLRYVEEEYRVSILGNPDSARGRALIEFVSALMTASIETGYRLAGGNPEGARQ